MITHLKLAGKVCSSLLILFRQFVNSFFYLTCNHLIFRFESSAEMIFQTFPMKVNEIHRR